MLVWWMGVAIRGFERTLLLAMAESFVSVESRFPLLGRQSMSKIKSSRPGLSTLGFAADLVIFDENTIMDRATYDKPHQFPVGIAYVIVNGVTVLANEQMTAARPGVALRGNGYAGAS
jgi:N-acyl-D-aspartate/D-glutamate deacylase